MRRSPQNQTGHKAPKKLGRPKTTGTLKPAILGCRVTKEIKEKFLERAGLENRKPQGILEGFVLSYV